MRRLVAAIAALAAGAAGGCGDDRAQAADAAPARDQMFAGVAVGADGVSDEVVVDVPAGARSLTILARGPDDALIGLASLTTADGIERMGVAATDDLPAALEAAYVTEQTGQLPGAATQAIRLGLFTHVYPNRPGDALPAGRTTLRLAVDWPGATLEVRALVPDDDGAATLPINVFAVSNVEAYWPDDPRSVPWLDEMVAIFATAGLAVEVRRVINLPDTGLSVMSEVNEPQEPPTSMSSALAAIAAGVVQNGALDLLVVDALPTGIAGWSLGTPGPPLDGTYYSGVVIENGDGARVGRVAAHEVAHFLGLQHVVNTGVSGALYPDPLDDTEPGEDNLMEDGEQITADQAFVLRRSALLVP